MPTQAVSNATILMEQDQPDDEVFVWVFVEECLNRL